MSILTGKQIEIAIKNGEIVITPFDINCLGSNSYDVHLSKYFAEYCVDDICLDAKKENRIFHYQINDGYLLKPNQLYLASTIEYTETHNHVPFLEGKSSTGRLGINIHATAGKGDIGFCNYWTLEISVIEPVKVYPGMPIAQLIYHTVLGENTNPYDKKEGAKYTQKDHRPQGSKMFKNNWSNELTFESVSKLVHQKGLKIDANKNMITGKVLYYEIYEREDQTLFTCKTLEEVKTYLETLK